MQQKIGWLQGEFAPVEQLGIGAQNSRKIGRTHCHGCLVSCSQLKLAKELPHAGFLTEGPETETIYAMGTCCRIDNLDAVIASDRLCYEYEVDTISTGVTIAFAMELYERGILKLSETDGIKLNFGNHQNAIKIIQLMAYGIGIGKSLRMAQERPLKE